MSALPNLSNRIQTLQDQLDKTKERPKLGGGGPMQRPNKLGNLTPECTRKKTLNLPTLMDLTHNSTAHRLKSETESKLREIMAGNGVLKIDGVQYQTDVSELEDLGTLGNGTSGHVVRMRHPATGKTIAVKQMRRTGNIEENKRIIMDIDVVLKSHDCPYIVQCLGCFITECDVWICMELMKTCFDKLLKRSTQPVPESIMGKITVATVRALSYLKEKHDVIHRDIKPSNILIDEHGNIKLCDFGISGRLVDSKAKTRSAGCAAYMAPERIDLNKSEYDIRADVWSLGITLVELATGSNPYKGCNTDFEVLTRVLESDPPSLPTDRGFSAEFQMFVEKCLTKNHLKRPKYPELLEQPFIRHYEREVVDVRGWFASVMQRSPADPHPHHTQYLPTSTTSAAAASSSFHPTLLHRTRKPTTTTANDITSNNQQHLLQQAKPTTQTAANHQHLNNNSNSNSDSNNSTSASRPQPPSQHHHRQSQIPNFMRPKTSNHSQSSPAPYAAGCAAISPQTPPSASSPPSSTPTTPNAAALPAPTQPTPTLSTSSTQLAGDSPSSAAAASRRSSAASSTGSLVAATCGTAAAPASCAAPATPSPTSVDAPPAPVLLPRMRHYEPIASSGGGTTALAAHKTQLPHARHPVLQRPLPHAMDATAAAATTTTTTTDGSGGAIVSQMNQMYRRSPFMQRRGAGMGAGAATEDGRGQPLRKASEVIYSNLAPSPFAQRKLLLHSQHQPPSIPPETAPHHLIHHAAQHPQQPPQLHNYYALNGTRIPAAISSSPVLTNRKRFQTTVPILEPANSLATIHPTGTTAADDLRPKGNTSPIVLQRFYHQQNQLRDRQERRQQRTENTNPFLSQIPKFRPQYVDLGDGSGAQSLPLFETSAIPQPEQPSSLASSSSSTSPPPPQQQQQQVSHIPHFRYGGEQRSPLALANAGGSPKTRTQHFFGAGSSPLVGRRIRHQQQQQQQQQVDDDGRMDCDQQQQQPVACEASSSRKATKSGDGIADADDPGVVKRRFASYVKLHLANGGSSNSNSNKHSADAKAAAAAEYSNGGAGAPSGMPRYQRIERDAAYNPNHLRSVSASAAHQLQQRYAEAAAAATCGDAPMPHAACGSPMHAYSKIPPPSPHVLSGLAHSGGGGGGGGDQRQLRHRSPDPPPRYNRGQSPLVLRRNLQELQQQGGSPLFQRRYTASPPMPPPRRGSESVPGSPHTFRTARIHCTPEPQRHAYRSAMDQ